MLFYDFITGIEFLEPNKCATMRMDSIVHDSFIGQELLYYPGAWSQRQGLDVLPQILKHIVLNMSDALPLR
jgi:hypothetical protein